MIDLPELEEESIVQQIKEIHKYQKLHTDTTF